LTEDRANIITTTQSTIIFRWLDCYRINGYLLNIRQNLPLVIGRVRPRLTMVIFASLQLITFIALQFPNLEFIL